MKKKESSAIIRIKKKLNVIAFLLNNKDQFPKYIDFEKEYDMVAKEINRFLRKQRDMYSYTLHRLRVDERDNKPEPARKKKYIFLNYSSNNQEIV